ncbi:unnamed protein product [Camellia sinensis]
MEHGWCWWQWSSVAVKLVVQVVMLVKLMVEIAYTPKNITFNNVIRALHIVGKVEEAMSVLVLMRWGSSVPTKNSFNILISEVNRQGRQLSACNVYGAALKIVVRVTYVEDDDGFDIVPPEVELYSLSRGCWQSISYCGLQSIIPEHSPQVYINGAVHWIAYDRKTNGNSLAAQRGINIEINVFGESLCVMHDVFLSGSNQAYGMWVMEKYSVVESWTKLFAIIDYQQSLGPVIGFRKNSEVLLERSENLVSYDLKTKETKNLGIHGVGCFFYVATYVESLVLVRGLKGLSGRPESVNETKQKRTATKSRKNRQHTFLMGTKGFWVGRKLKVKVKTRKQEMEAL